MKKTIPIGHEDFKRIREGNIYYVDKSLMIKELVDYESMVTLFTRPRRFGKTLNLSMIRRFFEDERTADGEKIDNGHLFQGLAIERCGEKYQSMRQQFPVISLSLKSARQPNYELAYAMLSRRIAEEFRRHQYVLVGPALSAAEKSRYQAIANETKDDALYWDALGFLSQCLAKYHEKNVIILIDEYDVPLETAHFKGFYDEMIAFIRSLFESALKTNDSLKFGVISGCLRISRESIFTGLNNLDIQSLRSAAFGESFGFTQAEVDAMLAYYELEEKRTEVKDWYDGYRIGDAEIYNPWSIVKYMKTAISRPEAPPENYWVNTSSNDIIRELVETADAVTKEEMEQLIRGKTIEKPVHEEITYGDIHQSMDNLWNFLYFTGYLKNCGERLAGTRIYVKLAVPNLEIRSIYEDVILRWFGEKMKAAARGDFYTAVTQGQPLVMEEILTELLQQSISYYDYAEEYYHGFLTGILSAMEGYTVVSNRESGDGRPDLILKTRRIRKGTAILLELKVTDTFAEMEEKCDQALRQIEEKHYSRALEAEGYTHILKYGICFFKKECMVKQAI